MNTRELRAIVGAAHDEAIARDPCVSIAGLTRVVLSSWTLPECDGSGFFEYCAHKTVRSAVERIIRDNKADTGQVVFSGMHLECIQSRYIVERENDLWSVAVEAMTPQEREAKAEELCAQGDGCYRHAEQLRRYNELAAPRAAE